MPEDRPPAFCFVFETVYDIIYAILCLCPLICFDSFVLCFVYVTFQTSKKKSKYGPILIAVRSTLVLYSDSDTFRSVYSREPVPTSPFLLPNNKTEALASSRVGNLLLYTIHEHPPKGVCPISQGVGQ